MADSEHVDRPARGGKLDNPIRLGRFGGATNAYLPGHSTDHVLERPEVCERYRGIEGIRHQTQVHRPRDLPTLDLGQRQIDGY